MENGTLDTALVPKEDGSLQKQPDAAMAMFERLASDPNVSVEKVDGFMKMWERIQAKKAEEAFNAAMSAAQSEMRRIAPDAFNSQTKSKYPTYAALDRVLRPIYTGHGFGLSFNTSPEAVGELTMRVLCLVTHAGGYGRTYQIDMPADGKGAKGGDFMTRTHAAGSAVSYGMRYLLKMIFNVAVGQDDDDGNDAAQTHPEAPKGYGQWVEDMMSVADEGKAAYDRAIKEAPDAFRKYAREHDLKRFTALNHRAKEADKAAKS